MYFPKHFPLEEFLISNTAVELGIDNTPTDEIVENLRFTAACLEEVRDLLGNHPIIITSGYRSPKLNAAVKGARDSQHTLGQAADCLCYGYGTPYECCQAIVDSDIAFDQLIHEYGRWFHISFVSDRKPRGEVLTIKSAKDGYHVGLLEV